MVTTRPAGPETTLDPELLKPGDMLGGRFGIKRSLGRGAMGAVFLAEDRELGSDIVIKLLNAESAADPEARDLFRREVVSARAVAHPNVVRVFDYHTLGGVPAMTMEHLAGGTLRERLQRRPPAPLAERLAVLADVADGLSAVHRAGIVHRDIKPANVLFGTDGRPRLTDFGIARKAAAADDGVARYTPYYAAPEQIRGETATVSTDVYALGAVAFHVLCLRPVFDETGRNLLDAHLKREPPDPRTVVADLPAAAAEVILRCLRKDAATRPADAHDVAVALRAAAAEAEPRREVSVLFVDLVAFSALATQTQGSTVQVLNRLVAANAPITAQPADSVLKLPTGDGMLVVFRGGPGPAYDAAVALSRALGERDLQARMGLHHGSVLAVTDVNDQRNVTGSGVNLAQRVMSFADGGFLMASSQFRDALVAERPLAAVAFRGPYEALAKHGLRMELWSVFADGAGREGVPEKLRPPPAPSRWGAPAAALAAAVLAAGGTWAFIARSPPDAPAAPVAAVTPAPVPPVAAALTPPPAPDSAPIPAPTPAPVRADPPPREPGPPRNRRAPEKSRPGRPPPRAVEPAPAPPPQPVRPPPTPAPEPVAPQLSPTAQLDAARQAMMAGRYDEAVRSARAALSQEPGNAEAHKLLANTFALQKRPCDAKRHFQEFIRLAPGNPMVAGIRQRLSQPEYAACR